MDSHGGQRTTKELCSGLGLVRPFLVSLLLFHILDQYFFFIFNLSSSFPNLLPETFTFLNVNVFISPVPYKLYRLCGPQ